MNAALGRDPTQPTAAAGKAGAEVRLLLARWGLGGVFVYMGLVKALRPDQFLSSLYHYDLISDPVLLNVVAGVLPWLEVFGGLLLILGVAVRGSALLFCVMLLSFNGLVFWHARGLAEAKAISLCAVKFDCGCGNGEIFACRKLAENFLLILLSLWLLGTNARRWCLRFSLAPSR